MPRHRRLVRSCRLLMACALALAAGPAARGQVAGQRDWMPLEASNRWSYKTQSERVLRMPQGSVPTQLTGRHVTEVTRRLGGSSDAFEIVQRGERRDAAGAAESGVETLLVSRVDGRLVLAGGDADSIPVRILRPVTLFPAQAGPGVRWDAGRLVSQGLDFDLQGEVLGLEDVTTPAGRFARCLKIRFTGKIGGGLDVEGLSLTVDGGTTETLEWYAADVGMVKQVTRFQIPVRLPDGQLAEVRETTERLLDDYRVGGGLPASPER